VKFVTWFSRLYTSAPPKNKQKRLLNELEVTVKNASAPH
jgi:hypothetical protein